MVARALYIQAGGADTQLRNINADPQIVRFDSLVFICASAELSRSDFVSILLFQVSQMLYGFLVRSNNSWFQQLVPADLASHLSMSLFCA